MLGEKNYETAALQDNQSHKNKVFCIKKANKEQVKGYQSPGDAVTHSY